MFFNFVASDYFDLSVLSSVEDFINHFPDFQTVYLTDENELKLLLELLNIRECVDKELKSKNFSKYWDISNAQLPEFDNQEYDKFYENWLTKTNRDNNMDEYGNLIFLQGMSTKWNKLKYRMIIKEVALETTPKEK